MTGIHQPYPTLELGDRVLRLVDGVHGTVTAVRSQTDYEVAWDEAEVFEFPNTHDNEDHDPIVDDALDLAGDDDR